MGDLFKYFPKKSSSSVPQPNTKESELSKKKISKNENTKIINSSTSTFKPLLPNFEKAQNPPKFSESSTHQDKPPLGPIQIPEGREGCLSGITFIITGTLDHLEREEATNIIIKYGGQVTKLVKKADCMIQGCMNVNQKSYDLAVKRNIPIIDEKSLLKVISESNQKIIPPSSPKCEKTNITSEQPTDKIQKSEVTPMESKGGTPQMQPIPHIPKEKPTPTLFTEKYRPTKISELVGNKPSIRLIQEWITNFSSQEKKAILISGPPGIGKTTSAEVIAKTAGYHVLELNASDTRNKSAIDEFCKDSANNNTIFKYNGTSSDVRTCFIFDEIDGMSTGDRGGIQALANFIQKTSNPVICICNIRDGKKLQPILKLVKECTFESPDSKTVAERLAKILEKENIEINKKQMIELTSKTSGDIRSAINNLQFWAKGISTISNKDVAMTDPCKAAHLIVHSVKPVDLERGMDLFYVDYDMTPIYGYEMMNMQGKSIVNWTEALESLSLADNLSNVIHSDSNFGLLNAYAILSFIYPATVTRPKFPIQQFNKPNFPAVLSKTASMKKNGKMMVEIASHCCRRCPMGRSSFRLELADLVAQRYSMLLAQGKKEELIQFLDELELTKDNAEALYEIINMQKGYLSENTSEMKKEFNQIYKKSHVNEKANGNESEQQSNFYIKSFKKL